MARAGDGRWETWLARVETFRQQLCGRKCLHYLFGSKHAHLDERMRQPNWTRERDRGQIGRGITVEITSETCQKAKTDVETSKCNSHTRQSQFQLRNQLQARSQNPTRFSISKTGRESVEALQHTIQLKTLFFLSLFLYFSLSLFGISSWWQSDGDVSIFAIPAKLPTCFRAQSKSELGVRKCLNEGV